MAGSRVEYLQVALPGNCKNFKNSQLWEEAFKLYNQANPGRKVKVGCGSCCNTVINWLNRQ